MDNKVHFILIRSPDDTKLKGIVTALEEGLKLQSEPEDRGRRTHLAGIRFYLDKCLVTLLRKTNIQHQCKMKSICLKSTNAGFEGKKWLAIGTELAVPYSCEANAVLECKIQRQL